MQMPKGYKYQLQSEKRIISFIDVLLNSFAFAISLIKFEIYLASQETFGSLKHLKHVLDST